MKTALKILVAAILVVSGNAATLAAPREEGEIVSITGELEPGARDAAGRASAFIYDEEWGLVLISPTAKDKAIFGQVGLPVTVTGQLKRRKEGREPKYVLELVSYREVGSDQGAAMEAGNSPPSKTRPSLSPEIITGPSGEAISVIGHYDLGLDGSSCRKSADIAEALRTFVLKRRDLFRLAATDDVQFEVQSIDTLEDGTSVAKVDQYVGMLRVMDSDITAALTEDGSLESINGTIKPNRSPEARVSLGFDRIIRTLRKDAMKRSSASRVGMWAFKPDGQNKWHRDDGATIEVGWSIRQNGAAWRAFLPNEVIWIDDRNGNIVRRASHAKNWSDSETTRANVRHRDWKRDESSGRAISLSEVAGPSGKTATELLTVGGDDWLGTCFWQLKRKPSGFAHGIGRIDDVDGGEQEVPLGCSSNRTPSFTKNGRDSLREQGAFWAASKMRFFINQNVWSQVAPNQQATLVIHMDDASVGNGHFFPPFFGDANIRINHAFAEQDVVMHEYGHYVVWTYDGVSDDCVPGRDEGESIDETLANVFGLLVAVDDPETNPTYGAMRKFANHAPHAHTGEEIIRQNIQCPDPDLFRSDGHAFQQAVWELMFNRDCTDSACTDMSGFGNDIWVDESPEAVLQHIGSALGRTLQVLGQHITHSQIREQMIVKIRRDSGDATANRARAVFRHHGI